MICGKILHETRRILDIHLLKRMRQGVAWCRRLYYLDCDSSTAFHLVGDQMNCDKTVMHRIPLFCMITPFSLFRQWAYRLKYYIDCRPGRHDYRLADIIIMPEIKVFIAQQGTFCYRRDSKVSQV